MERPDNNENEAMLPEEGKRRFRWGRAVFLLLIAAVLVAGVLFVLSRRERSYAAAELTETYEVSSVSRAEAFPFAGGVLRVSSDGVSLLSDDGRELWNESYSMNDPRAAVQGDCGAVADLAGNKVVVFNSSGVSGSYTTIAPVMGFAVSSSGITAVALDNDLNSTVQLYAADGRKLDISISLEMALSGYPLAMALSPDGNGLVISSVSSKIGALNSQLVFYNFSVGKGEVNRLIGYFNYEGHLIPQVDYLSGERVAVAADDGVTVFSLTQQNKPQELAKATFSSAISAYAAGSGHFALLCPEQAGGTMMLRCYDADGKLCFTYKTGGNARSLRLEKSAVLLSTDDGLTVLSYKGTVLYEGRLPQTGQLLFMKSARELVQFDFSRLYHYRLK